MPVDSDTVLVTGATGRQGGATARALLAAGIPVRALVRDPRSRPVRAIEALGAELVRADLSDRTTLGPALEGVRAVFSVQMPPMTETTVDFAGELTQATNLRAPGWAEGRWTAMAGYFPTKQAILEAVRDAGFARWTVIKPAFFMENLLLLALRGHRSGLLTVLKPDTELALDSDRFQQVELELAGDLRTMAQIAQTLSAAWGVPVSAPSMSLVEALDAGMPVLQPARPECAQKLGIPTTTFAEWADEQLAAVSGHEPPAR
ncbi:NmrA family NAD(P)-binding protein [Streptomyces sp. AM6-12]|uniref:NmrA family NAD(P)-binding protein n=1 Tax=Streptomyces sp. AM6-12 TaxID=3345149 RepID=UPI003797D949